MPNLAPILLHQSARAYRQIRLAAMNLLILAVIDYLVMRVNLRRDSRPGALRHFTPSFLRSSRRATSCALTFHGTITPSIVLGEGPCV